MTTGHGAETTNAIPPGYLKESGETGCVVRFDYGTIDYAGLRVSALNTPYDILYLMHGWTGTAEGYFQVENSALRRILDNLIEKGDIRPLIVVSPTFDSRNQPNSFANSVRSY